MSKKPLSNPLSGYQELLPREQKLFSSLMNTIESVYQKNGFIQIDQPMIDRTDSLLANVGGDTTKELMHLQRPEDDPHGQALRFDLTVPLARYVANNYGQLTFPFRRYAIGKVFRGERPQAGRFREFYQCDIDIIGNESLSVRHDAEIILLIAELFNELNTQFTTGDYVIRYNNRKLINEFLDCINVRNSLKVIRILDKKNKLSNEVFISELKELNLDKTQIRNITHYLSANTIENIVELLPNDSQGLKELQTVQNILEVSDYFSSTFKLDLSIARGLDYYTGTVFETELIDHPDVGSVCSGGRYDDLASAYTNKKLPGVGMSIGLTRLFDRLLKKDVLALPEQITATRVAIAPMTDDFTLAFEVKQLLNENNLPCEILFSEQKFDKKMNYIDKQGIPYALIIGEDEIRDEVVTLKNMGTGDQVRIGIDKLLAAL